MSKQEEPDLGAAESAPSDLLSEIQKLNMLMARWVGQQANPWLALRNGLLAGLGGTIGAALLGSILVTLLRPFDELTLIKDALERLSRQGRTYSR